MQKSYKKAFVGVFTDKGFCLSYDLFEDLQNIEK